MDRVPWQATLDLVGDLLPDRITVAGEGCGAATRVPSSMQGAVLTATGMDHQSAAFACGAATTGSLFDSMGTAEAFLRFTPVLCRVRNSFVCLSVMSLSCGASSLTTCAYSVRW